jgi:hypothetical protein
MNKSFVLHAIIPVVIFATLISNIGTKSTIDLCDYSVEGYELNYTVDTYTLKSTAEETFDFEKCYSVTDLGKSFVGFKEAIAFKESSGDYFTVNTLGYLGKYQFGKGTLELIGIYNPEEFLSNPELQEKAFIANAARNKWILRRDIKRFVGKRIDGVLITESGILAAAHLAGPGSVKKYLRSYGAIGFTDAYGTNIRSYMRKFSGYDTSFVKPNKKAKVSLL